MSDPMPTDRASVSDLLEAAVRVWRLTLPRCLPLAMIAILCIQLANIYWLSRGHPEPALTLPSDGTYRVLMVAGSLAYLWLISALVLRQRALITGGPVALPQELLQALRRQPVLLGTLLLAALVMVAAAVALGEPLVKLLGTSLGIGLVVLALLFPLVYCLVIVPVVMFEGRGPLDSARRCVRLVHPLWWKSCAAMVIGWLVIVICSLVLAALLSLAAMLAGGGQGNSFRAVVTAVQVGASAIVVVFFSALWLVLYSAASSSA